MTSLPTIARVARALPLIGAAGVAAYGLLSSVGVLGGLLLAVILLLAACMAMWARSDLDVRAVLARTANAGLLCAPALLIVFFSFSSGGFFPDSVAIGVLAVAAVFVVRLGMARQPLSGIGRGALAPLAGLIGLSGWALLSQIWSHAPGRAAVGFDRDLLYLLTFALFASIGRTHERLAWAVRTAAFAMAAIAAISLISRVAPDVLVTAQGPQSNGRLAYPLTYWNALGVFCAVAAVLCLHLAADDERREIRIAAAGALPVLGTTLLLSYSRGGLAVAVIGLALYAVLGRPRGLLSALIAAAPGTAIAMKVAYDDTLLSGADPTSAAAIHQGHRLALVVAGCVALAIVLRAVLVLLDRILESPASPIDRHARALRRTALGAAVVGVVVAIALGATGAISNRWDQFVNQPNVTSTLTRSRLGSTSNSGRIELWTIAWNAFQAHPLDGTGADTYEILWYEHRHEATAVVNAHSLYIETLSDLGIAGLVFVVLFVVGTLVGLAPAGRGRDRPLYAALFCAGIAWAIHAGVDWDWQMPATSIWFAALGGLALGRPGWGGMRTTAASSLRAALAGLLAVGACVLPALVLASQVRLNEATTAYGQGDCVSAHHLAQRAIDLLGTRAPPWQIEAFCSVNDGKFKQAQRQLRSGLAEDPSSWQLRAALAATTAAAGGDARHEVKLARRLNPLDPGVQSLARALSRGPSAKARRAAIAFLSDQTLIETG